MTARERVTMVMVMTMAREKATMAREKTTTMMTMTARERATTMAMRLR